MVKEHTHGDINISRIPVDGIGGLGLVVMAGVVVFSLPALRWVGFVAGVGGVATGLTLLISRHHRVRRAAIVLMALLALGLVGAVVFHRLG
jgi:hypothetical protein